jgi:hypothetical protein
MKIHKTQFLNSQISNWPELLAMVDRITPHGDWIFRGLRKGPDKENNLEILSHFDEAWRRRRPEGARKLYEAWMLREFRREAYHHLHHLPEREDLLEWLALGRHYGMPVRLVDFTYSFYIAVYFAISRKVEEEVGWILAFNIKWHKQQLETYIVPKLLEKCNVPPNEAAFQDLRLFREFAINYNQDYVAAVNPFRRNPRLASQQGLFLCPANIEHDFDKNLESALPIDPEHRKGMLCLIQVPHGIRNEIIRELRRMNISSASLFRDLSGWAESQGDLVYYDINDKRFQDELNLEFEKPRREAINHAN